MRLEDWHLIIIVVLALVLFAAPKLPGMARSLGQSMRIFKSEIREMKKDDMSEATTDSGAGDRRAADPRFSSVESRQGGGTEGPLPNRG